MPTSIFQQLEAASQTTADVLSAVAPSAPFETADYTPPLTPIGPGGLDVAAGAEVQLVAATAGRLKTTICHTGVAGASGQGRLWLGIGATAQAGRGIYLDPGDVWEEFYAGAVRVLNTGSGSARVSFEEWSA